MTFEIWCNERWVKVTWWVFRSWSGMRRVNGRGFAGRSFYLGTNTVASPSQHVPSRLVVNK